MPLSSGISVSFAAIAIIDKEVVDPVNGVLCLAFGFAI